MKPEMDPGATTCGNCGLPMPKELRFCRSCGYRLGEGAAEYTETVRFQNAPPGTLAANRAQQPGNIGYAGPLAASPSGFPGKRRSRISGTAKLFMALIIFFVLAGAFTAVVKRRAPRFPGGIAVATAPRSFAGVNDFETTEGGVTFERVDTPGGPADLAGLVGGDIITTVDGQPVHSDDEMSEIMRRIPIGKTVDVIYLRDGETKNTKMTTISEQEMERLKQVFTSRPQGRGRLGYNDSETAQVPIEGTKMSGVRLDEVSASLPADMAGIRNGDVVVEFDGIPIRTPEELASRVRRAIPYETIKVAVMRGGERLEIPVKMGRMQ